MCLISVNVVILVLLSIAFLIIVHRNLLNLSDFLKQDGSGTKSDASESFLSVQSHSPCCKKSFPLLDAAPGAILPFESGFFAERKVRTGEEIPVVITASEERLGAAVAAMNSINRNSKANVVFSVVTLNESVEHLR